MIYHCETLFASSLDLSILVLSILIPCCINYKREDKYLVSYCSEQSPTMFSLLTGAIQSDQEGGRQPGCLPRILVTQTAHLIAKTESKEWNCRQVFFSDFQRDITTREWRKKRKLKTKENYFIHFTDTMVPKFAVDLWKNFQSPLPQINIQYKLLSEALNISPSSTSGKKNEKILPNQITQLRI